ILPWLESSRPEVRRAAVSALDLDVEEALERAIEMLGDESPDVRAAAHARISEIGKEAASSLLKGLTSPKKALKEGILHLLESLEVKDVEFSEFLTREIRSAYENIRAMRDLRTLEQTPALGLLIRHLEDKNDDAVFTVFRILEVEGEAAKVRTIYRGLRGAARDKANALEALEDTLHSALSRVLIPLLDDISPEEKLKVAQNEFAISDEKSSDPLALLARFLESEDSTTQTCALYAIGEDGIKGLSEKLQSFEAHPDRTVQETAKQAIDRITRAEHPKTGKPSSSTMDKVPHLMKADIFSDLQVRELIAISSVTGEKECPKDEILVREGEPGDTMFVIISGEVSIIQNHGTPHETLINTIAEGDCFGEMALFEDKPRANTVRTNTDAKFLVLGKREFEETMKAYPQIPINICRVFSERIRTSNTKLLD
ncbi:MAG: cyclic nucleotide-binding domain-containing protein, partial [Anaerolineales bacterium]|nr:cyclic nucleotide-binding domain-containing protein [Anaerolineales bacterium]